MPVFWRTTSHSVGFSDAWVWMRTPRAMAIACTSRSSFSVHESTKRGARA